MTQQKRRHSTGQIDQVQVSPKRANTALGGDVGRLNKFIDKLEIQLAEMSPRRITDSIIDITHPKHALADTPVLQDTAFEYFKRVEKKNTAEVKLYLKACNKFKETRISD
jgi:hypothetical protein